MNSKRPRSTDRQERRSLARERRDDPTIRRHEGHEVRSDDVAAAADTGRSGPHDIGTRSKDVPATLGADLGGAGSPTNRLWEEAVSDETRSRERSRRRNEVEVDLPIPPDNLGGPPPRA
jgi:hypothetical protein